MLTLIQLFVLFGMLFSLFACSENNKLIDTNDDERSVVSILSSDTFVSHQMSFNMISSDDRMSSLIEASSQTETSSQNEKVCTKSFVDLRDEKIYSSVQIGTQCWMAENLAYIPQVDSGLTGLIEYYYVYGYTPVRDSEEEQVANAKQNENFKNFGVLYNWYSLVQNASLNDKTFSVIQGVCPMGWHIPTSEEWEVLAEFVANDADKTEKRFDDWLEVGKLLKMDSPLWKINSGTNAYGFNGLPGGAISWDMSFHGEGEFSVWWSISTNSEGLILIYALNHFNNSFMNNSVVKGTGASVRCIKDDL